MRKGWGALWVLAAGVAGCGDEGTKSDAASSAETACVSDLTYFQQEVSGPITENKCFACHNAQGSARNSKLVLLPPGQTDYLRLNYEKLKDIGSYEKDGVSILLLKPTAGVSHGGGEQIDPDSDEYAALEGLIARFKQPVTCNADPAGGLLTKVRLLDLPATLRRAGLQLVGTLPTSDELENVSQGGEAAFDAVLSTYMESDAFYATLLTWFNDQLLTNKYLGGDNATNLLDENLYPNRHYYHDLDGESEPGRLARRWANDSVAREPLALIEHVVREGRSFQEILTADYILVNPYSAKVYGLTDVKFDDETDPTEWREAKLPKYPHAGILTSPMFLNRYPTTDTNVNRHRSRMVQKLFLATDVLKLAERPVDPTQIKDHNPTMNNPACAVCHAKVDPIAGAFMNWDPQGRYSSREEGWIESMRPPGYGEESVPPDQWPTATKWLAEKIVKDRLFAVSAVSAVYQGLVGRAPLENPTDDTAPGYKAQLDFVNLEQAFISETTDAFVESGYKLKSIVPLIVRSPFFRAYGAQDLTEDEKAVLAPLGTMKLLTPEQLDAKLHAVFGRGWQRAENEANQLLARDQYLFFYGGIDSDQVTRRITEPNGIMANIGLRLANEMACLVAAPDFTLPIADRTLFPHVEYGYAPEDANGFEVPESIEAIKKNIRYLHFRILGEVLSPGDPEIERTYQLFLETWREVQAAQRNNQLSLDLPGLCQAKKDPITGMDLPGERVINRDTRFTIRAWMAVIAYLTADWRFLYQQ